MSEFEYSGTERDEEEEDLRSSNGFANVAINSKSPRGNLQREQRIKLQKSDTLQLKLDDEGKNRKKALSPNKIPACHSEISPKQLNIKPESCLAQPAPEKQKNLTADPVIAGREAETNSLVSQLGRIRIINESYKVLVRLDLILSESFESSYRIVCKPILYALNKASNLGHYCQNLTQRIKNLFFMAFDKVTDACLSLWGSIKESYKKFISRNSKDATISPQIISDQSRIITTNRKAALNSQNISQISSPNTTYFVLRLFTDLGGIKRLNEAIKSFAESLIEKFKQKRKEQEQALAARKKEIEIEATNELMKAKFLRPDLAAKLEMPQLAFLESSPFANVPSALDLIQKADKT